MGSPEVLLLTILKISHHGVGYFGQMYLSQFSLVSVYGFFLIMLRLLLQHGEKNFTKLIMCECYCRRRRRIFTNSYFSLFLYSNILFLLSCASLIVGITSAGEDYKWSSFKVLLPLLLGVGGILVYGVLEWFVVTNPTVPFIIMGSMTSLLGYTCNILHGIVFTMSGGKFSADRHSSFD